MPATRRRGTVWQCFRVWALALVVVQGLLSARVNAKEQALDHKAITIAVETALVNEGGVPGHLIDVNTRDGVVTPSGRVDNLLAKERAGEIAESVKGVRAVINRIAITTVRPDGEILNDVRAALQADPATDAYEINATVQDGVGTLFGAVDSQQERWLSARVETSVKGVKAVTNELTVKPQAQRPDHEIAADVRRRLAADVWEVIVSVVNGKAYLSGTVDSRFERDQAEGVASRVAGVDNNITVASTPPLKSDWEIRQDIRDELWWSPYVDSDEIAVSVKDGVATVRGLADDWAEQCAAIENAYEGRALGVRDELTVKSGSAG